MHKAVLKFDGREVAIDQDVTTIGRISENLVSFPTDSNVSRYHAEIERRGGDLWLIDLQSSNGTTVNGEKVTSDRRLKPGDKITLGGSSTIELVEADDAAVEPDAPTAPAAGESDPALAHAASEVGSLGRDASFQAEYAAHNAIRSGVDNALGGGGSAASAAVSGSSSGSTVMIAGAVAGLAIVCAVAAGAIYYTRGSSSCSAVATITKPESGDTISKKTDIEIDIKDGDCVQSAVFMVDGQPVATADDAPFTATLDPRDVPEFSDGGTHSLQLVLVDASGAKIPQSGSVELAFETRAIAKVTPTPGPTGTVEPPIKPNGSGQPSLLQINEMTQRLVKQFPGKYNVSNKEFLTEIQKRTAEYAQEGYFQRASVYRETITIAFVREQNIDAPLAFMLAMSRSKFNVAKQGDREGLWQLSTSFVKEKNYDGLCGTETLSDQSQKCAANSAALYLKALVTSVFAGEPIYAAVAFGRTTEAAGEWRSKLPADHSDLWNAIKEKEDREQLVRFFAAGIVAENPQAFGLKKDRPLSELYNITMQ